MILALLTAISAWLSAGTLAVNGDTERIAALPSIWICGALAIAAIALARIAKLRHHESWPLAISLLVWLPFLPGPMPAAFLLWQGPIEAIVWLSVVGGLIAVRRPVMPRLLTDPRRAPLVVAVLLTGCSLAAFSQVRGVVPGGDEPHYLATTQSVLHDGDLRVANNYAAGEYLEYFPGRLEPHYLKRSADGDIYSIHAPGVSLIVLPAFAAAGYPGAVATMILIAALTASLSWRLAWRISGNAAAAWLSVIAVFGTAPYFLHTFTIYPEIIGGFLVTAALWLLLDLSDGVDVSLQKLAAVGSALALLPWLHSRFAILAGLLGVIILLRLVRRPHPVASLASLLTVPAVAAIAWFAFFWVIWGSPSPAAPYGADTSTSASYILRGLIGLLADQQFGVLTTAPVYLIAGAGAIELFKRQRRLTIELLLVAGAYAITVASYQMWWAGSAAPARFVVAILPLAVVPLAAAASGSLRTIAVLLVILSVSLVVPRVLVEGGRFIFNSRAPFDATIEWLSQIVDFTLALPSVYRDGASIAARDGFVWLAMLIAAGGVALAIRQSVAVMWSATALALAAAVMTATSIVWALHAATPRTPNRSKIAALAAYRPGWQTPGFLERIAIDLPATARLDRVPAGEYRIDAGQLSAIVVGRRDAPIDSAVDRFRLPVATQFLNLRAEQPFTLRPVAVASPAVSRNAVRAARFGRARVFVFDERAYLEHDGFWTRADDSADVVIDTQGGTPSLGLPISITAGPVATTIELSIGSARHAFSLAAGQQQEIVLPPAETGVWPLHIRSGAGFRPSEHEPGSRDVRLLAAWIAIR